jgi:hypothetical protein
MRQIPEGVEPVFLPRETEWVVGCDLGTAADYTAVSVIESVRGVLDWNTPDDRQTGCGLIPQQDAHKLYVKHLERYLLGLSYMQIIERVAELMSRSPLCGDDRTEPAELVADATGVGAAVVDLFDAARLYRIGGLEAKCVGDRRWHVSKEILISGLDAALHDGSLVIASALTESHALKNELKDFRRTVGAAGRATYGARAGKHDDLVLSIGIAVWWARRPEPPQPLFGRYGTFFEDGPYSGTYSTYGGNNE